MIGLSMFIWRGIVFSLTHPILIPCERGLNMVESMARYFLVCGDQHILRYLGRFRKVTDLGSYADKKAKLYHEDKSNGMKKIFKFLDFRHIYNIHVKK